MVAIKALKDQDFVRHSVSGRQRREEAAGGGAEPSSGFQVFPSEANFILFKCPIDHRLLVKRLAEKGVMIRDFGDKRRLENCVRTTIGTEGDERPAAGQDGGGAARMPVKMAIADYGVGNLHSIRKALENCGAEV